MSTETTLCTVIEAGYLEQETLLLAESLRRFGGARAHMPLVAVRPRAGPRIAAVTKRRLQELDVHLVEDASLSGAFSWWATINKPAALGYVEQRAKTPHVTWIDGDMMILREPDSFVAPAGMDFIARAGEATDVASNGSDEKAEFWERLCATFNLSAATFPDIISWPDEKPIKAYWQAGLFTYPRARPFAGKFREIKESILTGDIASRFAGTYHTDQVALTLTVEAMGFKSAQYDPRMNFNVNPLDKEWSARLPINEVKIMQYHGALWPADYAWTRDFVSALPADRLLLLDKYAPLTSGGLATKVGRRFYAMRRKKKIAEYERRVKRY